MEYNKKKDLWIGTPKEHLQKLLDTHDCMCDKVRRVLQGIIDEEEVITDNKEIAKEKK